MKKKSILINLEEDTYDKYKKLCKEKGLNMSQRIRNFIKNELKNEN